MSEWDRHATLARLAAALPDIPRWLETRSMLLLDDAEVFGLEEEPLTFIARNPSDHLISVVGKPAAEAFQEAVYRNDGEGVALAQLGDEEHAAANLPGWRMEPATLHLLPEGSSCPPADDAVRLISVAEIMAQEAIPAALKDELRSAALYSDIAATFADGRPISFCYCASVTEGLWDISIDTLEPYRRQGHAAKVVSFMVQRLAAEGKRPVWGAEESNEASMALARKLGFEPVERLVVFHAPGE